MAPSFLAILILLCIVISYMTRIVSVGVTSILGALAMALAGIITPAEAMEGFGSDTVMMVVGMIVVGNTLYETGLANIIGESVLKIRIIRGNEKLFLVVILLFVTLFSAFMSNTAAVAMFLPLIASVVHASKGKITRKNTYMAVGIASVVGGNLTLVGSTPQMVAQGILAQTEGCSTMGLFDMTRGAFPSVVLMLIFYLSFGYRLQTRVFNFDERAEQTASKERGSITPQNKKNMILSGAIFLFCIAGFISGVFTLGTVALLGACACVATKCISAKRAVSTMDWSSIIVLGGALGFSKGLDKSGAIELIVEHSMAVIGRVNVGPYVILAVLMIIVSTLSNVMSNTATTAIIFPIALGIAKAVASDPMVFAIGIVISSNLAFATPISTPPLTMTLSGGYRFSDYVKVGGLFTVLSLILTIVLFPILYSF